MTSLNSCVFIEQCNTAIRIGLLLRMLNLLIPVVRRALHAIHGPLRGGGVSSGKGSGRGGGGGEGFHMRGTRGGFLTSQHGGGGGG